MGVGSQDIWGVGVLPCSRKKGVWGNEVPPREGGSGETPPKRVGGWEKSICERSNAKRANATHPRAPCSQELLEGGRRAFSLANARFVSPRPPTFRGFPPNPLSQGGLAPLDPPFFGASIPPQKRIRNNPQHNLRRPLKNLRQPRIPPITLHTMQSRITRTPQNLQSLRRNPAPPSQTPHISPAPPSPPYHRPHPSPRKSHKEAPAPRQPH